MLISPDYKCKVLDKQERGKKAISVLRIWWVGCQLAGWHRGQQQHNARLRSSWLLHLLLSVPTAMLRRPLGAYVLGKCMGLQALHHHCCSQDLNLSSASQLGNEAQGTSLCTDGGCAKPHPAQPDASVGAAQPWASLVAASLHPCTSLLLLHVLNSAVTLEHPGAPVVLV